MNVPSLQDAFAVLCLQAADNGRGPVLLGDGVPRARELVAPLLVGDKMPEIYLEFPLTGEPFMDVTLLYGVLPEGVRIDSPLVDGTREAFDLFQQWREQDSRIACGYEVDCGSAGQTAAGMHFQPRAHRELVEPFCEALGEPERAKLYLAQDARMPQGWPLSFFGLFRGRPDYPLRVCGYLNDEEVESCARDPQRLARAFAQAGFEAYDDALLAQAARVLELRGDNVDFQFDVMPDGSLGPTFAFDLRFDEMCAEEVRDTFRSGIARELVAQLQSWGIADGRADLMADLAFTRGIPVTCDDGSVKGYGFSLVPGWLKVRWKDAVLQPAKMYLRASAGLLKERERP